MKLDKLIEQRFSELTKKAEVVASTRTGNDSRSGVNSERFHEWATGVLSLLQSVFGESSPHHQNFFKLYSLFVGYYSDFEICRGVFRAAKEDYESGYLFSVRGLIKAEDSTDILDRATEILKAGYKDPACVLAGVALEITLKELCTRNGLPHGKLDSMNIELCKKAVYNMGMQKQITAWAHWRNKAAHGEWHEYKDTNVDDMVKGVTRFIAEYL